VATNGFRKLNPHDRSERNAEIVAARANGASWRQIEQRFGVSGRQARRVVRDVGTARVTRTMAIDPTEFIETALMHQEALIEQLAEIADSTDNPMVAINAIRAQGRANDRQVELLQNAGLLPAPLTNLAQHIDAQRLARRAIEVLNRHQVPAAVKQDLLDALRGS
jgi:hypothetical protein